MRVPLVLTILLIISVQLVPTPEPQAHGTPILTPNQTSPCPTPGPADISNQQIPFSTSNETQTLPGHVVLPVRQRHAVFTAYLSDSLQLHLEIVFKIRNLDQFQQCLNAINDPSSPYHEQFLNATTLEPVLPTSVATLLKVHELTGDTSFELGNLHCF